MFHRGQRGGRAARPEFERCSLFGLIVFAVDALSCFEFGQLVFCELLMKTADGDMMVLRQALLKNVVCAT